MDVSYKHSWNYVAVEPYFLYDIYYFFTYSFNTLIFLLYALLSKSTIEHY